MTDATSTTPPVAPDGAGAMLRAARQQQGLHIAALAASIKVTPAKLEALESGRYHELPDTTFARALAKTVCRVLKIDPEPVLAQMPGAPDTGLARVDGGLNTPFRERPGRVDPSVWVPWRHPVLWAVALLLFAGIRPSAEDGEISRLQWEAVDSVEPGHIYVSAAVSKTNTDRHILITPRLGRLLRGHPKMGPVIPANWPRVYARLRKEARLGREQDLLRHTFASNFLVAYGDDRCKEAMGHTPGSTTLFRHYRRSVVAAAGEKYFGKVK